MLLHQNQVAVSHQIGNNETQINIIEQQRVGGEQQIEGVESQKGNVNHQIENVEHVEHELEPEQERENELDINFQHEPIEDKRRKLPMLAKYVRRHRKPEQIIGDVESSIMTRKRLKDDT